MVKVRGQNSDRNTVKQTAKLAKTSRVTTILPALRHWCQVSRIRGRRMVFNLTGRIWFTMAGRLRSDSGWSWTLQNNFVALHVCEVAPLMSQMLEFAIFSLSVWPFSRSIFDLRPSPLDSTKKIYQIRAYDFGVQFPLTTPDYCSRCRLRWMIDQENLVYASLPVGERTRLSLLKPLACEA